MGDWVRDKIADIKPDNVFVEMRGGFFHAKIIDLGLSALKRSNCSHITADGSLRGTLEYCAPEVWKACKWHCQLAV